MALRHIKHNTDIGVSTFNQLIDAVNVAMKINVSGALSIERGSKGITITGKKVVGGSQIRNAYCKTDAGSGDTIDCYLDEDGLNDAETNEVTVTCTLIEATDLEDCFPTLSDGTMMPVWKDTSGETAVWRSLWWFQGYEECA